MAITDKLTSIAAAIRERLNTDVKMTMDEMPGLIRDIGIGYIPDYWRSYLDNKAAAINSAINAAGEKRSAFLWYTDAHWLSNYGKSPMILKFLSKNTGISKTFFGGDIANNKTGEVDTLRAWQALVADVPNHHSVLGNHDNQVTDLPSSLSDFFLGPERTGDVVFGAEPDTGGNYYYIDNHIENTRYICMSTGRMWVYADETRWLVNVLGSTPDGWHIVIVSHLWLDNKYESSGTVLDTTPPDYVQFLLNVFDDYNYRKSGTTAKHNVAYDFSAAKGKIEFIIGGHIHRDYDFSTATGIPVILTECDSWQERDDASTVTQGTTTENCVYAIVADYVAKAVKVINVGRGSTRSLKIPDVVTYTNQLSKSLTLDGSGIFGVDYNGDGTPDGYKRDTRTSSSGDTSATGWCVTGLIPAKPGDIIRFKNMEYYDISGDGGATPRTTFFAYSSTFQKLTNASHSPSNPPEAKFNAVYGDNGDIIQLTAPSGWGTYAYIRLCCGDLNENSIITVNEEIGSDSGGTDEPDVPATSDKNKLKTAIGFDGEILDGQGYRDGARLSTSSNAYSSVTGYDCTGMIKAKQGDVIRLKNVSWKVDSSDYPRVSYRKANYDTITQTKLKDAAADLSPVYDGDNIVQITIPSWSSIAEIEYIIICAQDINSESVITVNEEI